MKKILCCFFVGLLLLFYTCINLKAMPYTPGIFDDFIITKIERGFIEKYNTVIHEYRFEEQIYIFSGTNNGNDAYIVYDYLDDDIKEFSLTNASPWSAYSQNAMTNLILLNNGNHAVQYKNNPTYLNVIENNQVYENINLEHVPFRKAINLSPSISFNLGDNITAQHEIDNSFYFKNLYSNFGYNSSGSCYYIALGMLLSYYKEFVADDIIPNEIITSYNNESHVHLRNDFYNDSNIGTNFDISQNESPGANNMFHNYLFDLGVNLSYSSVNDGGIGGRDAVSFISYYLNHYTDNTKFDYRVVSDARTRDESVIEESLGEFPDYENYDYYNSITDHSLLCNEYAFLGEYEFDIIDELNHNRPVLVFFFPTNEALVEYMYNISSYDGNDISCFNYLDPHAAVAYGYVQIGNTIYYKCHMGWHNNDNSYTDVYVKNDGLTSGLVIRLNDSSTYESNSSYYHTHENCVINLPTDNVYHTLNDFALNESAIIYDDNLEYFTCPTCGVIFTERPHQFRYRNMSIDYHKKYCNCGYTTMINHVFNHGTDDFGHYQDCNLCLTRYYAGPYITNVPISEMQHQWNCSLCNTSGIGYHSLNFEQYDSHTHIRSCLWCNYSEHVNHGIDESIIQYYIRDNSTHYASCDRCGFAWIEPHNDECGCIIN